MTLLWPGLQEHWTSWEKERERARKEGEEEECGGLVMGLSVLKAEWETNHTWKSARIWRAECCLYYPHSVANGRMVRPISSCFVVFVIMRTLWLREFVIGYCCLIDGQGSWWSRSWEPVCWKRKSSRPLWPPRLLLRPTPTSRPPLCLRGNESHWVAGTAGGLLLVYGCLEGGESNASDELEA